ncbi:hypothetical protein [Bradyrhizobium tunisiense]|uniref:hypothetical protein n=1 Tax=Bradyrhizobium tunisiense TaxID=3278709 RepID=UPI0035D64CBB
MRKQFGFLAKPSGLFGKSIFKGGCLLDAASLHGAAPFREEGGSAMGVLITDKSQELCGDNR